MKKKVSILLLSLLILPLTLLFGCGETVSYTFYSRTSSSLHGDVTTVGTYSEGETVSITATAKNSSSFIGWVKESTTLLENNSTYTIKNTTNSSDEVTKSVLSFTSSSATQGTYTAVFSEGKVMFVKLSSIYFTTDLSTTPTTTSSETSLFSINSMIISETANFTEVITIQDVSVSDGTYLATTEIASNNSVMELSTSTEQYFRASLVLINSNGTSSRYTLRAGLTFQTESTKTDGVYDETQGSSSNYTYHIEYDGANEYKIVFTFTLSGSTYYMVATYNALS